MTLIEETNGETDMFSKRTFDYEEYERGCLKNYGLKPSYDWAINYFGGKSLSEFTSYSKILFTNGNLDPWYAGGVTKTINEDMIAFLSDSAHHLELRSPHPKDPTSVV